MIRLNLIHKTSGEVVGPFELAHYGTPKLLRLYPGNIVEYSIHPSDNVSLLVVDFLGFDLSFVSHDEDPDQYTRYILKIANNMGPNLTPKSLLSLLHYASRTSRV